MQHPYIAGQALWGMVRFQGGEFPKYIRPYLIVSVEEDFIELLTVSTIAGKEWKLTLPTNKELINYNPPFPKRTFVKLDSLQRVHISTLSNVRIAEGVLNQIKLDQIRCLLKPEIGK